MSNVLDVVMWQKSSEGKLVIVEIIREGLVLFDINTKAATDAFYFCHFGIRIGLCHNILPKN